jgi:hypothetical protein
VYGAIPQEVMHLMLEYLLSNDDYPSRAKDSSAVYNEAVLRKE